MEDEIVTVTPTEEREQLEALYHLLTQARGGLEKIEADSDGSTAYMHARNARIDLNEALRRLTHLLGYTDVHPHAESGQEP